jgi:hypothetical protein
LRGGAPPYAAALGPDAISLLLVKAKANLYDADYDHAA